jgi:hypothetical protein
MHLESGVQHGHLTLEHLAEEVDLILVLRVFVHIPGVEERVLVPRDAAVDSSVDHAFSTRHTRAQGRASVSARGGSCGARRGWYP